MLCRFYVYSHIYYNEVINMEYKKMIHHIYALVHVLFF